MKFCYLFATSLAVSSALAATVVQPRSAQSNDDIYPPYDKLVSKAKKLATAGQTVTGTDPSPDAPDGYSETFGPVNGIAYQGQYLANQFLDSYDLGACSDLCATRRSNKGLCKGFNVYRLSVDNAPTAYNCIIFGKEPAEDGRYYKGTQGVTIDWSRGYSRDTGGIGISDAKWTQSDNVDVGDGYATFRDPKLQGTLVNRKPFSLVAGKTYTVYLKYSCRPGRGHTQSLFALKWNGAKFGLQIRNDTNTAERVLTYQTPVATGSDFLTFYGGSNKGSFEISSLALYPN